MVSEYSMPTQDLLVIGLGYVGLPLAVEAARAGFRVTGYDTGTGVVAGLMAGRSHVGDVTGADVAGMLGGGFRATADEARLGPQDVIVICVPTPLSAAGWPGPERGPGRRADRGAAAAPGHAGVAGEHDLPRHHRGGGPAAAGEGLRADRRDWLLAGVLPGADRPGQPRVRPGEHAQDRRRGHTVLRGRRGGVLPADLRRRSSGPSRPARRRWPSCWRTPTGT